MFDRTTRREILVAGGTGAGALAIGGAFPMTSAAKRRPVRFKDNPFVSGVASGEPSADGVVLWTKLGLDPIGEHPLPQQRIPVQWVIAEDEGLRRVVQRGRHAADPAENHTVHVEVNGLQPGREYFYRFYADGLGSPLGRTKTAPAFGQSPANLTFCFVSCSQFEHGYFTAYKRIVEDDPAFLVHVGDYIYEYGTDHYMAPGGNARHFIGEEITTLSDYRRRYAQYHTDEDLLEARRLIPFITTPDDHEVENNYANLVSEVDTEPDQDPRVFQQRRAAAYQAYYEAMPLRRAQRAHDGSITLFRALPFGDLGDVVVADTRQFRTDQPCGDQFGSNCPEMNDPNATLPGMAQERWLVRRMGNSRSRWTFLAQQVVMAQDDELPGPEVGFNTDAWDGYKQSRNRLLGGIQRAGTRNPVVLTGDVHQHYAADLKADYAATKGPASKVMGSELVATSITSGGDGDDKVQASLSENPWIKYNRNRRGYVRVRMDAETLRADFRTLDYVKRPGAPARTDASFVIEDGQPGLKKA